MKRSFLVIILFAAITGAYAQATNNHNGIKLFIHRDSISSQNSNLPVNLRERLYMKIMQLINQTGIAEMGYSNFWVMPKFDVLTTTVDRTGTGNLYMAHCELFIAVSRREYAGSGGAVYASFSKKVVGSARNQMDATSNAIDNISPADKEVVTFFLQVKTNIAAYFNINCKQVVNEAAHARELNDYARSIALYFSVPYNSPCYAEARNESIKVYKIYKNDQCRRNLTELKALVATIQTKDLLSMDSYNKMMDIVRELDPSSEDCHAETMMEILKIEKKFDAAQQHQWEMEKTRETNNASLQKDILQAIEKISHNYHPGITGGSVIITK